MAARKYSKEEMEIALQKRRKRNRDSLFMKRQASLLERFNLGDDDVSKCGCGKYFNNTVQGSGNFENSKRLRCIKCPLAPLVKTRRVWSKKRNGWYDRPI